MGVLKFWHRLLREDVDISFLAVFKAWLSGALSN